MNGITIVEQACPICTQQRTARFGLSNTFICFNCRRVWSGLQTEPGSQVAAATAFEYVFTGTEARRFHVYRAAVRAGFYTDW